jgi:heme oxygenase
MQLAELLPSAGKGPDACDYRWTLERLYGFYAAFEREAFKSAALRQLLPDWTERRKEPWLEDDLYWMGYTTSGILRLTLCRTMPSMSSIEALMGGTYVCEVMTLNGALITSELYQRLLVIQGGVGSFFHGYGNLTTARWAAFCGPLRRLATPQNERRIVQSALDTFEAL